MSVGASAHQARLHDAEEACERLRVALEEAGVLLPSLGVDIASCVYEYQGPLLSLGGCDLVTADPLVEALRAASRVGE